MNIILYKNKSLLQPLVSSISFNDDDTIDLIKKKILISLQPEDRPSSINEIYLYIKTTIKTSTLQVLQILSNNFSNPVTYKHLKTFCKNFVNIDVTNLAFKQSYEYYDILDLGFELEQEVLLSLSLYSQNKMFVVDPYEIENDDFSNDIQANTQFNKLLLDLKSPDSIIYYC